MEYNKDYYLKRTSDILARFSNGEMQADIAKSYGVSRQMVHQIIEKSATQEQRNSHALNRYGLNTEDYNRVMNRKRQELSAYASSYFYYRKSRAKISQSGIGFYLTYDEWLNIWRNSGKWTKRGPGPQNYIMSRIDQNGSYELGNVQIIMRMVLRKKTRAAVEKNPKLPDGVTKEGRSYVARFWDGERSHVIGHYLDANFAGKAFALACAADRDKVISGDRSFLTQLLP